MATDVFVTTDELFWLGRSGSFARALLNGQQAATFQTGHPGVTTMWTAVASLGTERAAAFAGPRREVSRREVSQRPDFLPALAQARRDAGLITALAVAGIALLTWRLFGPMTGLVAGLLLALDPFFLAHSRLLHIDAQLAAWMSLASLAAVVAWTGGGPGYLVLAGLATGLALLAKAPSAFLLGFVPLAGLAYQGRGALTRRRFWVSLAIWAATAVLTYVAAWPAMWSAPRETLHQVLEFMRENANPPHALGPLGQERAAVGPAFYWYAFLLRATPLTLLGLLAGPVAALLLSDPERAHWRRLIAVLLGYCVLFGIAMTFAAKNFDRYLLPIFPLLAVVGGFGWAALIRALAPKGGTVAAVVLAALLTLQGGSAVSAAPYYLTYFDPLAGGAERGARLLAVGWGEGLDQAAAYLNSQPEADRLRIALPGEIYTTVLGSQTRGQVMPAEGADPGAYDYLVVYVRNLQLGEAPPFLDERFQRWTPEHVVRLGGVDYAWIHETRRGIPLGADYGDGFTIEGYGLNAIAVRPGGTLQATLYWRGAPGGRQLEVRLAGPDGVSLAQSSSPIDGSGDRAVTRLSLALPSEIPSGEYALAVRILDLNGQPLALRDRPAAQAESQPDDPVWIALRTIEVRGERR